MNKRKLLIKLAERGMTQSDLSKLANINRGYLSNIMNNKANPSELMIHRIAIALDCKVEDIL